MLPQATWYPDPSGRHEHRYWDGGRWTEHVADGGIAAVDPLPAVTADDQVNGGVAADIAAVAMASTSTESLTADDTAASTDDDGDDADAADAATIGQGDGEPTRAGWTFVMPPETFATLHDAVPGFVGPVFGGDDVGAPHGVVVQGDTATVALDLDGPGVIASIDAVRATFGGCRIAPTAIAGVRELSGDGQISFAADQALAAFAPALTARVVVALDRLVAADGAATLGRVVAPVAAVEVADARWLLLAAGPRPSLVESSSAAAPVATDRVIAWTDGVALGGGDGTLLHPRGRGHVLLADSTD